MEKVLVTGGAGFIGSHLIDELTRRSYRVKSFDVYDRQVHKRAKPAYMNKKCEYVRGDVRDKRALRKALAGADIIFHFAAQVGVGQSMYKIHRYVDHNTCGTANLLDIIVNNKLNPRKVIVASSMSIYGEGEYACPRCGKVVCRVRPEAQLVKRDWEMRCPRCGAHAKALPTPESKGLIATSVYGITKKDQEELCLVVGKSYQIPTVALRFFNVYGPRQSLSNPYTGVCAIFSSTIKNDCPPIVYEDGNQTRDFVHVRDIVQANIIAMEKKEADYEFFNVGCGRPVSVLEIAHILITLYGKKMEPMIVNKFRAGDIRHCFADISKITKLGYKPSVSLETGLRELVAWGKKEKAANLIKKADAELDTMGLKI